MQISWLKQLIEDEEQFLNKINFQFVMYSEPENYESHCHNVDDGI